MSTTPSGARHRTNERRRLATAMSIHRMRSDAPNASELAYALYAAMLVALVFGAGLVRFALLWLLEPEAQQAIATAASAPPLIIVGGALAVVALLAGQVHGPTLRRPWFIFALAGSDLPLSISLRRPLVTAFVVAATVAAAVVALPVAVLVIVGSIGTLDALAALLATLSFGVLIVAVWLLGQALRPETVLLSAVVVALVTAGSAALANSAAVVANSAAAVANRTRALADTDSAVAHTDLSWLTIVAIVLTVFAILTLLTWPRIVDRLSPAALLSQAERWELARALSTTGDVSGSLGLFRGAPRFARSWRAAPRASAPFSVLVRDLVALWRTPSRAIASIVAAVFAGYLVTVADVNHSWPLATVAGVIAFLASGAWCDGLRHAADAAGRPTLYGYSPLRLATSHSLAPFVCGAVCLGAGAALAAVVTTSTTIVTIAAVGLAMLPAVGLATLLAAMRAYDAARPPLPIELLMPIPTPVGDLSIINVALWQADALLIAVVPLALVTGLGAGPGASAVVLVMCGATVAALAAVRFRRLVP